MQRTSYYVINGITFYRLVAAPFLVFLIFTGRIDLFKWLLGISFFTDLIDGWLARQFKVASVFGTKLDSIADDLTILAAVTGMIVLKRDFFFSEFPVLMVLLGLFAAQNIMALIRYKKITSFHTYFAKAAAILQGVFFILLFFLPEPVYVLFYAAAIITAIELAEEILLVYYLPEWKANVKGLFWVIKERKIQ
ncbi:MAG TPA: CDP-alcohol phosphatidyltransferase family protein [Bacteroidia bacterium]|nr:CDP-alcohol phosphatidyltransferase family protein [Bacteroidia bacterium]